MINDTLTITQQQLTNLVGNFVKASGLFDKSAPLRVTFAEKEDELTATVEVVKENIQPCEFCNEPRAKGQCKCVYE